MGTTIDERVVSMQFDNKDFEKNVEQSLNTVDKLKKSLDFQGVGKGLEELNENTKKMNFNGLASSIETVKMKFSAFEWFVADKIRGIYDQIYRTGMNLATAFTIDPVKSGLQEYETQINAVQTILANTQSKGSTLEDVNKALDELNTYADKTIYNFTEMTRNIGTFTAAGVDLKTATNAIQGIANLAAISGSTSQQASTAMYQLSQALSSGTVKLQDWNSVVNAGMGGQVFQDALKETARVHGIAIDDMIKSEGSFRETLQKGWLTSDILTETLSKFTMGTEGLSEAQIKANETTLKSIGYTDEQIQSIFKLGTTAVNAATKVKTFTQLMDTLKEAAQSGWTQTWEILIGDFEEAKALWTSVSDVFGEIIGSSAEARNALLEDAMTSSWDKLKSRLRDAGYTTDAFVEKVNSIGENVIDLDPIISQYGSLEKAIRAGVIPTEILISAMNSLSKSADLNVVDKILGKGNKGKDVEEIQKALQSLGYDLGKFGDSGVDGVIGSYTEAAIKEFQKTKGLKVTGIVDAETLSALKEATSGINNLGNSMSDLLSSIDEIGGRQTVIDSIKNIFAALKSVVIPVKEAFRNIFPPTTAEQIKSVLNGFKDFTSKLILTNEQSEKLKEVFEGLFGVVKVTINFIKNLISSVVKMGVAFTDFGLKALAPVINILYSFFKRIGDAVQSTSGFAGAIASFGRIINAFADKIAAGLRKIFEPANSDNAGVLYTILKSLGHVLVLVYNSVIKIAGVLGGAIKNFFETGDIDRFINALKGLAETGLLLSIRKLVKGLMDVGDGDGKKGLAGLINSLYSLFSDSKDKIAEMMSGITNIFKSVQDTLKATTLLEIGIAIGLIAASLWVLSGIDSDALSKSITAMTVMFAELMGSLAIVSKISGLKGVAVRASVVLISISTALLILSSAVKKLSSLTWDQLTVGLVGVFALLSMVVGSLKILSKFGSVGVKGIGQIILIAAAVNILAKSVLGLAALSWKELAVGLVGVAALLGEISIFLKTAKFESQSLKSAVAMVIIGEALERLAVACAMFGDMSWGDLGRGLAGIAAILAEVSIFSAVMSKAKGTLKTAVTLVILGQALKTLATAISYMSEMSWKDLGRGLVGIAGALLAIGMAMKMMPSGSFMASIGVAIISKSLQNIVDAMTGASSMSWSSIARGIVAIGASMAVLAVGLRAIKGTAGGSMALLAAAVALKVFVPVISKMSEMSWTDIGKGLLFMAAALTVVGIAGIALKPVVPALIKVSAAIALFGVGVALLGAGILALSAGLAALAALGTSASLVVGEFLKDMAARVIGMIPSIAVAVGQMIIGILDVLNSSFPVIRETVKNLVMLAVDVIAECAPNIIDALVTFLVRLLETLATKVPDVVDALFKLIVGVISSIGERIPELIGAVVSVFISAFKGIADVFKKFDISSVLDVLVGIGELAAVMVALAAVAALVPAAMIGVAGITLIVAEITAALAALGAINQIPGLTWLVGEGGNLLETVGNAIGKFIGGIVGGVQVAYTNSLPAIGTNLSTFIENLEPFIEGSKSIDNEALLGVRTIVSIISAITDSSFSEAVVSFLTGTDSMDTFNKQIVAFGEAMVAFSSTISGKVDNDAVESATNAGLMMSSMINSLPDSGGLFSWFTGDKDFDKFTSQITAFGEAIVSFSNLISGNIDSGAITDAATAGKVLASMVDTLPETDGVFNWFSGEKDFDKFSTQIVSFGSAMTQFSEAISGKLDSAAITDAATAGKLLASMVDTLPQTDGVFSWFIGDKNFEEFSSQISSFGTAMANFSTAVSGNIDSESVSVAVEAGKKLAQMANEIPESGGLFSIFNGSQSMETFGTEISAFGLGLKKFANKVRALDIKSVESAISVSTKFSDITSLLVNDETIGRLGHFALTIEDIADGLEYYSKHTSSVDTQQLASTITSVNRLASAMLKMQTLEGDEGSKFKDSTKALAKTSIEAFVGVFTDSEITVSGAIAKFVSYVKNGFSSNTDSVGLAAKKLSQKAVDSLRSMRSSFVAAGKYVAEGFANGITQNAYLSSNAARNLGVGALSATQKAIDSHSPSKKFKQLGKYSAMGFAEGITSMNWMAVDAATGMANDSIEETKSAIDKIIDSFDDSINTNPVIKPILDLSDIESGSKQINSLMDLATPVATMSNIGYIGDSINRTQYRNDDVIDAIKSLGEQLENAKQNVYSINGITYDDGTGVSSAIKTLISAVNIEGRM